MARIKKAVTANVPASDPQVKSKTVAAPKAKAAPREREASKFVSVEPVNGNRMRVSEYQDYTFSINDGPKRRLTDEALAADWRRMFPHAVAFTTFHVTGARRDYNKGIHSKAYPGTKTPPAAAWYLDGKGKHTQTVPAAVATEADEAKPAPARKPKTAA